MPPERKLVPTMEAINRAAVVVKPRQPFLDWLNQVDPTSQNLTLSDIQREPKIYLVSEYVYEHEVLTFLTPRVEPLQMSRPPLLPAANRFHYCTPDSGR